MRRTVIVLPVAGRPVKFEVTFELAPRAVTLLVAAIEKVDVVLSVAPFEVKLATSPLSVSTKVPFCGTTGGAEKWNL